MDARQINKIPLLPFIKHGLKKAGVYHIGPCPFCGGRDRFIVMPTSDGDRWYCRKCGEDKYHTVIDFIMKRDQVNFLEACKSLAGGSCFSVVENATQQPKPQPAEPQKTIRLPDALVQKHMLEAMDAAADDLESNVEAQTYLYGRGLTPATWEAWHIGAAIKDGRPAITLPWYYMDAKRENIIGIKYRFIDSGGKGERYTSHKGSVSIIYGLWAAREADNTVLFVEGEINALSLWQCGLQGVTVLSIGSDSGGGEKSRVLETISRRYGRVFIWCDDPGKTTKHQAMISQPVTGINSATIDGVKLDANKLLQAGLLPQFIKKTIGAGCDND